MVTDHRFPFLISNSKSSRDFPATWPSLSNVRRHAQVLHGILCPDLEDFPARVGFYLFAHSGLLHPNPSEYCRGRSLDVSVPAVGTYACLPTYGSREGV